jgi:hypothetical protein
LIAVFDPILCESSSKHLEKTSNTLALLTTTLATRASTQTEIRKSLKSWVVVVVGWLGQEKTTGINQGCR